MKVPVPGFEVVLQGTQFSYRLAACPALRLFAVCHHAFPAEVACLEVRRLEVGMPSVFKTTLAAPVRNNDYPRYSVASAKLGHSFYFCVMQNYQLSAFAVTEATTSAPGPITGSIRRVVDSSMMAAMSGDLLASANCEWFTSCICVSRVTIAPHDVLAVVMLRKLWRDSSVPLAMAFSNNGCTLANLASAEGGLYEHDVRSGACLRTRQVSHVHMRRAVFYWENDVHVVSQFDLQDCDLTPYHRYLQFYDAVPFPGVGVLAMELLCKSRVRLYVELGDAVLQVQRMSFMRLVWMGAVCRRS